MLTKKVKVGDKEIEVRQLIMEDLEEVFAAGNENKAIDLLIDFLYGKPQALRQLLTLCTPCTADELLKMGANDFAHLVAAMREANADFFGMWQQQMIGLKKLQDLISGKSAAPMPASGS